MRIPKISIKETIKRLIATTYQMGTFVALLMLYLTAKGIIRLSNWKYFPQVIKTKLQSPLSAFYTKTTRILDARRAGSISRVDLIELSIRNMKAKKTRTIVTIGGMMIGIGAIVFLVSIGYGLQQLVITRVARLEEMKQADVTPQAGGKVKITDKTLSDFKDITTVEMSLPLIAVVGRVNYQNSVSDMAAYGVTTDYLKQSAIKPVQGKIFDSNELVWEVPQTTGEVAGASTEKAVFGQNLQNVDFTINPSAWIRVRESPATTGKILGYTKRVEDKSSGEEVWGGTYESDNDAGKAGESEDGEILGKWVKAPVLLWKEENCDQQNQGDCEDGKHMVMRDEDNKQMQKEGYFA
ncbi:MAG: ABC transporter permease, partial [Sphaerochaetaceae bacterium]